MSRTKSTTEKLLAEVGELRVRIGELRTERAEVLQSPTGKGTALARADAYVQYLAGEARVNVAPFVSREAAQARDLIAPAHVLSKDGIGTVTFDPVLHFLAWMSADLIRAKFVAGIEAHYATRVEGLDDEPLAQRLTAIDAELLDLETDEEKAIMALEAAGVRTVLRRADADPRALVAACS